MTNEEKKNNNMKQSQDKEKKTEREQKILEAAQELYVSILESKTEVTNVLESIDQRKDDLVKLFADAQKTISSLVKDLERNTLVLHQVPKKIDKRITDTVPEISIEVDRIYQRKIDEVDKVYQRKAEEFTEITKDAASKLEKLQNNLAAFEEGRKKRFFFSFLLTMLCAGVVAGAASYTVLQKYPSKVFLRNTKSVVVEGSEVSFWGSGEILLQDGKKSKKKK